MLTLGDINRRNEEYWQNRKENAERLMGNPHIVRVVLEKESAKAKYVRAAVSESDRIERIRHQRIFESELEQTELELKPFLPLMEAQSRRARRLRGKIEDDGTTLSQIIGALASNYPELTSKELWCRFFGQLDELGLQPEDVAYGSAKSAYIYDTLSGKRKRITFGQFSNVVSKTRRTEHGMPQCLEETSN